MSVYVYRRLLHASLVQRTGYGLVFAGFSSACSIVQARTLSLIMTVSHFGDTRQLDRCRTAASIYCILLSVRGKSSFPSFHGCMSRLCLLGSSHLPKCLQTGITQTERSIDCCCCFGFRSWPWQYIWSRYPMCVVFVVRWHFFLWVFDSAVSHVRLVFGLLADTDSGTTGVVKRLCMRPNNAYTCCTRSS